MAQGTVAVRLKKDWFGPDGSLYQTRDNPHEFPAHYADKPKKNEGESDEDFKARSKRQPFAVLPSSAEVVGSGGKTVAVYHDTANGSQVLVAENVDDDVKSVGGALNEAGVEQPSQTVAAADKAAEKLNIEVGAKPRESGPLPAGHQKTKG